MENNCQREFVAKMYDEYIKNDITMDQIGKKYGRNKQWVSRLFQKYGYKSKGTSNTTTTNDAKCTIFEDEKPDTKNVPKELLDAKPPKSIRAFSDRTCDYYRLNCDFGNLKKGTIFYHDKTECNKGTLKLCWSFNGWPQQYSGGSIVFPFDFSRCGVFDKIESFDKYAAKLKPGKYTIEILKDGTVKIDKEVFVLKY